MFLHQNPLVVGVPPGSIMLLANGSGIHQHAFTLSLTIGYRSHMFHIYINIMLT